MRFGGRNGWKGRRKEREGLEAEMEGKEGGRKEEVWRQKWKERKEEGKRRFGGRNGRKGRRKKEEVRRQKWKERKEEGKKRFRGRSGRKGRRKERGGLEADMEGKDGGMKEEV
ncbi:unnamed protein product [Pleuronectes platessa]|uniref:Uncharacterized protein n=1 Tax=Pleuronectes platessa TaxID=8262 RepID=A0A9N7UAA1_PLEPL|nr:unnamed protein product [Pleuronectes platessa]